MEDEIKPRPRAKDGSFTIPSRPWADVIAFFRSIPWAGQMAWLAEAIASSRHGEHLYPVTSMHTIVIGQTPEFSLSECVLRIEPTFERNVIVGVRFEYRESPWVPAGWTRECRIEDAPGVLERFLARAHWFVDYRATE